jgi:hypothetical protein
MARVSAGPKEWNGSILAQIKNQRDSMKRIFTVLTLLSTITIAGTLKAYPTYEKSVGSVPTGHTGSIAISVAGLDSWDGYSIQLVNTTTGQSAWFYAYLNDSPPGTDGYDSGLSGSLSGYYGAWYWEVEGLPPGNYVVIYHATWPGEPFDIDMSPYWSVSGSVFY